MGIIDIFSKRKKRAENAGRPDVYRYDKIPPEFRIQVIHLWVSALGSMLGNPRYGLSETGLRWQEIHDALAREHGRFSLGDRDLDPFTQCQQFIQAANVEGVLDIIEVSFGVLLAQPIPHYEYERLGIRQTPDDAVRELNRRFEEHRLGYRYDGGKIIKLDSQYLHEETVRPALTLLTDEQFTGALAEFMSGHEHYRHGRYKEAIVDSLKAFESTMKTILQRRRWPFDANASAQKLIQVVFEKELLPTYLTNHFTGLRTMLEGGVPTVRNKTSGHGQGPEEVKVPAYLAAYALHVCASNIVLLIEAHRARR